MSCYPNPVNDFLTVKFNNNAYQNAVITVADATGKICKKLKVSASKNGNEINIDLKKLSNGVYFISIEFDNERFISKFVKQ